MKFVFTKHAAVDKFEMLERHNFRPKITKRFVKDVILHPEYEEVQSESPRIIRASKIIDKRHVLRVVYRRENDIIIVITF